MTSDSPPGTRSPQEAPAARPRPEPPADVRKDAGGGPVRRLLGRLGRPRRVPGAPAAAPGAGTHRIAKGALALVVILFVYHLFADRITPYTPIAHVQAFVVQIAPRVASPVIEVNVIDNQQVAAGDVLFRIDPRPFEIAVQSAEAALQQAGQDVGATTAEVSSAEARLAEARADLANVRAQANRVLQMVERGIYAEARGDDARAEVAAAE